MGFELSYVVEIREYIYLIKNYKIKMGCFNILGYFNN